jgi:hypothetical protein
MNMSKFVAIAICCLSIFLSAELTPQFFGSSEAANLIHALADRALRGAEEFIVRPTLPLYLPGEPVEGHRLISGIQYKAIYVI